MVYVDVRGCGGLCRGKRGCHIEFEELTCLHCRCCRDDYVRLEDVDCQCSYLY